MATHRGKGAAADADSTHVVSFDRVHFGLPEDAPWLVRVVLRSRAFLIVGFVIAVVAASNPDWLLRIDQPISDWVRELRIDLSFAKVVTQFGSPNLVIGVGLVSVIVLWRRCRASFWATKTSQSRPSDATCRAGAIPWLHLPT